MKVNITKHTHEQVELNDDEVFRVANEVIEKVYNLTGWEYVNKDGFLEWWEDTHGSGLTHTGPKATPEQTLGFEIIRTIRRFKLGHKQ